MVLKSTKQYKMKITAVNRPVGTISVMWNDNPQMEWNYWIPLDVVTGRPLEANDLIMALISTGIEGVRSYEERITGKDYKPIEMLEGKDLDVTELVDEYDQLRIGEAAAQVAKSKSGSV